MLGVRLGIWAACGCRGVGSLHSRKSAPTLGSVGVQVTLSLGALMGIKRGKTIISHFRFANCESACSTREHRLGQGLHVNLGLNPYRAGVRFVLACTYSLAKLREF